MSDKTHRNTIFVEDAEVLFQQPFAGNQYVLRLHSPQCAAQAKPGSFIHLVCDPTLPMRRPMSIMRASKKEGWIECLYKVVGEGSRLLATRKPGDMISSMGPIGRPFRWHPEYPRPLLIGGGVGIPPMVFTAEVMSADKRADWQPFAIMGSEVPFPFETRNSAIPVAGMPATVSACMPFMENLGYPSRLASQQDFSGCFRGFVTDLADVWLNNLSTTQRSEVEILACGPTPMLEAVARLARVYQIPCQVSLEEFMACGVGGCAGCTVLTQTAQGPAMKRVCVDGPVFDAAAVFPSG